MERTATMPMAEYDDLVKGLQSQTELIKELKKQDHVVLIDERYSSGYNIPRVICGEDKAKEYLKNDYDNLNDAIKGIIERDNARRRKELLPKEENASQVETIAIIAFVVCFIIGLVLGHYFF